MSIPNRVIKLAKTTPEAAPTNKAGEKTPPKKPVEKQIDVKIIYDAKIGNIIITLIL